MRLTNNTKFVHLGRFVIHVSDPCKPNAIDLRLLPNVHSDTQCLSAHVNPRIYLPDD